MVSIEASRLARNGRDWHTLLEFCGLVGTLIVDEDGVYDPRHPNDRLLLGMKGTMSEMELSLFRQRSLEALKQKARRGELFLTVAIGYLKTSHDRIEKDPDRRVQEAIMLVFGKFAELQTVRQVHLWMRQERLPLPATEYGPEGRKIVWKLPVYNTLHHMLTNPIYAGAYVFGRTGSRITIWGTTTVGVLAIVLFLWREARTDAPGPLAPFSLNKFQRRKFAHAIALCRIGCAALLSSLQPDSGPGLHTNASRRSQSASNPDSIRSFPMGSQPGCALWCKTPAGNRANCCRVRLSLVRQTGYGRKLLGDVLSRNGRAWPGNERRCSASHHHGDGFCQ